MAKKNKKYTKRVKNLVVICTLSSLVFIVTTFAWFIGMRTVTVSTFDVSIATTDSLLLSLDGKKWDTTVTINSTNFNDTENTVYVGNANTWSNGGLIPMSSVGEMDETSSRMKLYQKASLTKTAGGYRLMASRVANNTTTVPSYDWQYNEGKGYVAFDLFVKNFSGEEYYTENNVANEEAIYLTDDSVVKVAADGVANTGIENSVRVAFAQIGRVIATTNDPSTITSITCKDVGSVTGICRTAQIWEPNETKHVAGAIKYYTDSCKARSGANVLEAGSYTGTCGVVNDEQAYHTYSIAKEITDGTLVDVYDGEDYNTYTQSATDGYLKAFKTFTDADKNKTGVTRDEFFTLAPNSITKVRVYIYIEGQDIDNYDLASIGKKISVAFGFTKDRFDFEEDPDYIRNVIAGDTTAPTIAITRDGYEEGSSKLTITKGTTFKALEGVTATDDKEGNITPRIQVVNNTVNTAQEGTYIVSYLVSDWAGNYTQKDITVEVQ